MRFLKWVLTNKKRVTLMVAVAGASELLASVLGGQTFLERAHASTPRSAVVIYPFLIALAVLVQVRARKDTRRRLVENGAYGMTLLWGLCYAFVLFVVVLGDSAQAMVAKVFLLKDTRSNQWCAYTEETAWNAAVQHAGAVTVGTLTYSRRLAISRKVL
jgi:hypothetical protein